MQAILRAVAPDPSVCVVTEQDPTLWVAMEMGGSMVVTGQDPMVGVVKVARGKAVADSRVMGSAH